MWPAQAWQFGMCGWCLGKWMPLKLRTKKGLWIKDFLAPRPRAMDDFNTPWKTNGWNINMEVWFR